MKNVPSLYSEQEFERLYIFLSNGLSRYAINIMPRSVPWCTKDQIGTSISPKDLN